jgi:hypothetical protein
LQPLQALAWTPSLPPVFPFSASAFLFKVPMLYILKKYYLLPAIQQSLHIAKGNDQDIY